MAATLTETALMLSTTCFEDMPLDIFYMYNTRVSFTLCHRALHGHCRECYPTGVCVECIPGPCACAASRNAPAYPESEAEDADDPTDADYVPDYSEPEFEDTEVIDLTADSDCEMEVYEPTEIIDLTNDEIYTYHRLLNGNYIRLPGICNDE